MVCQSASYTSLKLHDCYRNDPRTRASPYPTLKLTKLCTAASQAAELQNLSHQLTTAQTNITTLTQSNTTLSTLLTDYENALTLLLDKLRPYAYNQTQAILSLHKHYNGLLDQE